MPVKLSTVLGKTDEVELDFGGEKLKVTYRPNQYTPRLIAAAAKEDVRDGSLPAFLQLFVKVIAKWDLLGEDGKPIPITEESLADVPYEILNAVTTRINQATLPNVPTPANSGSFS